VGGVCCYCIRGAPGGEGEIRPHLYSTATHFDDPGAKLDSDGVRAVGHELLLRELVQQAALADAHVPDDDVLEDIAVVVTARGCHRAVCVCLCVCVWMWGCGVPREWLAGTCASAEEKGRPGGNREGGDQAQQEATNSGGTRWLAATNSEGGRGSRLRAAGGDGCYACLSVCVVWTALILPNRSQLPGMPSAAAWLPRLAIAGRGDGTRHLPVHGGRISHAPSKCR